MKGITNQPLLTGEGFALLEYDAGSKRIRILPNLMLKPGTWLCQA
jgi:hypothetical protein